MTSLGRLSDRDWRHPGIDQLQRTLRSAPRLTLRAIHYTLAVLTISCCEDHRAQGWKIALVSVRLLVQDTKCGLSLGDPEHAATVYRTEFDNSIQSRTKEISVFETGVMVTYRNGRRVEDGRKPCSARLDEGCLEAGELFKDKETSI